MSIVSVVVVEKKYEMEIRREGPIGKRIKKEDVLSALTELNSV